MESVPPYEGVWSGFESQVLRQTSITNLNQVKRKGLIVVRGGDGYRSTMWVQLNRSERAPYKRVMLGSSPDARTIKIKRREEMKPLEIKESQERRKERVRNSASLRTRVVENKKAYNRKKEKARIRRDSEAQK